MRNVFKANRGFGPFFDERVTVTGTRSGSRVVTCACLAFILDGAQDDALATADADSTRARISVQIRRLGEGAEPWTDETPPQVGDILTRESGETFAITSCDSRQDYVYLMEARDT